jgi:hypothetical protein
MALTITYLAHLKDNEHREDDEDILYALRKLGHKVYPLDDREFDMKEIIKKGSQSDMFLFHKGGVNEDSVEAHRLTLERLQAVLLTIKQNRPSCKLVFWYVDKVYKGREEWMNVIAPLVDYGFLVDETFIRRHNYTNLLPLKQAAPDKFPKGKKNPIYECDIAFTGIIYDLPRQKFVEQMSKEYGDRFRVYTDVWGKDFADLCKSAKIIIAPDFPLDDFYWGNRIYKAMRCGAFMVHPRLYGLTEQGIINNAHFIGYYDWDELKDACDSFLLKRNAKLRKKVAQQGQDLILKKHLYTHRVAELLSKIQ